MKRREKISVILNAVIFVFTAFATVSMIIGFQFMSGTRVLSSTSFKAFKYFTVDSNVFAGLVALACVIYKTGCKGKTNEKVSKCLYMLQLAATTGVTLTMMVTVFFLAPRSTTTYFAYFMNSNLFMHLLTPLLCIVNFIFFEKTEKPSFSLTFAGVIPMLLYSFFYIPNILLHLENGATSHEYDWYGFLDGGIQTIWFVLPLILIITWLFSFCLWLAGKSFNRDKN